jgi:hypothetical protein
MFFETQWWEMMPLNQIEPKDERIKMKEYDISPSLIFKIFKYMEQKGGGIG